MESIYTYIRKIATGDDVSINQFLFLYIMVEIQKKSREPILHDPRCPRARPMYRFDESEHF